VANDFASIFGIAENAVTGASDLTSKTAQTEQKIQEGIQTAQDVGVAYAGGSILFQAITAFTLLYVAAKMPDRNRSKKT
jgi:hypothetical protein